MTRTRATAAAPAAGLLLALLLAPSLAACGSGTDRAVPGPTTPPTAPSAAVASAEPALATTGTTGSPAAGPGATDDATGTTDDATDDTTGTTGAPGAGGASATATAGLVAGFPRDVLPVLPGATVTASAVRRSGDRLGLSLSGTTDRTPRQVISFYDKALRTQGFTTPDGRATIAPGTGGRIYARGDEVVVVAVTRTDGAVSFSVGGTVRA